MTVSNNTKIALVLCSMFVLGLSPSCEVFQNVEELDAQGNALGQLKNSTNVNALGVASSAHVKFGDENAGSPFPPQDGHDASIHAKDKMVPRTVVIARGGEVHYEVAPVHQVAIYAPGTKPGDINLSPETLDDLVVPFPPFVIPDFIINDPNGRVDLSPPQAFNETMWTTSAGTFDTPGKYLVICTTLPHFAEADMFGWVMVK